MLISSLLTVRLPPSLSSMLGALAIALASAPFAATAEPDPVTLANPLVGTAVYGGGMYPGAALPGSMVKLSPDTTNPSTAGYAPDQPILGFSHTHIGGTGGKAFGGQIRVRPQSGTLNVTPAASGKSGETASPGYYAVTLTEDQVRAELTVTERAGFHRYTFPAARPARVLIDASSFINNTGADPAGYPSATTARWISDREIEGSSGIVAGYANMRYTVHFVAVFDQPALTRGAWLGGVSQPGTHTVTGGEKQPAGLYGEFNPGSVVNVRIGISYTSIALARQNLAAATGLDFDAIRTRAESLWRAHFSTIAVEGGTDAQRRQFYTALYHTVLAPTDVTGDNAGWAADDQPVYWDIYTLWDTFRTTNPLLILIKPELQAKKIRSLLAVYQKTGWLPDAWVYSRNGIAAQGGTHADHVIAEAIIKDLQGFDRDLAYAAIRKNATQTDPGADKTYISKGRFAPYLTDGYVPVNTYKSPSSGGVTNVYSSGVSRTLEYAYNDYSISLAAAALGKTADATLFRERSLNAYKLFHPDTKFFWGKTADGQWIPDADPALVTLGWTHAFYEGSAWQYRFTVPRDMQGLINRLGGPAPFLATLDEYFDRNLHWQGNEPCFLTPWLHGYAGRPDKNVDRVQAIMAKNFKVATGGYPGDEDVGAMSAWYIFAAMGFYPNAGQDLYLLGSPVFSKVTLRLGQTGQNFVVSAPGLSPTNKYVQSATLNGQPWNQAWFRHGDIVNGAELVLTMGAQPSAWGTLTPPPSITASTPTQPTDGKAQTNFGNGNGTTSANQFPGLAGDGWTDGWTLTSGSTAAVANTAPAVGAGNYLKVTRTAGTAQNGIYRPWADTVRPLNEPARLTFQVRLDSTTATFNTTGDTLTIAARASAVVGAGGDATFFLRAFGAATGSLAAREWGVFNGDPGVANTYQVSRFLPTGVILTPGTVYTFTIDLYPVATGGRTAGTFDVTISDGVQSRTLTGLGFRTAATTLGGYLTFATEQDLATDALSFSVDTIELSPLSPAALTLRETWTGNHFTVAERNDPAREATLWGHLADPDADGVNNLLEYALNGDPLVNSPAILPAVSLPVPGSPLQLTFLRARADLTYVVQGSSDLAIWADLATNPGTVSTTTPVVFTDSVSNPSRRFLRLRVTAP
jgi:predicted alpha-1,2-mannosidase